MSAEAQILRDKLAAHRGELQDLLDRGLVPLAAAIQAGRDQGEPQPAAPPELTIGETPRRRHLWEHGRQPVVINPSH